MGVLSLLKTAALAGLAASPVDAAGRPGVGFIGLGIEMYQPPCAHACKDAITAPLNCTSDDMLSGPAGHHMKRMEGMSHGDKGMEMGDGWMVMKPGAACKVHNNFYLQTLAYCINTRCPSDIPLGQIETFWVRFMAGREDGQPEPRQSYTTSLAATRERPTRQLNNSLHLNYTGRVTDDQYIPLYNANVSFETVEGTHTRFGLAILLSCFLAPIAFSLLRFLPWPASTVSWVHALLIDPPLFGTAHAEPLWGLGVVPTRGQALFLAYIWIINIALSAAGYSSIMEPHSWYELLTRQVLAYVGNRVGVLSFANLPLVYLFAGRNNILLWLTDWSHTTFLLLHRWIGFICMLQAVLHSILYLHAYTRIDEKDHAAEAAKPYWYWGIIGTLALSLLIPASIVPLRTKMYEVFLTSHIILAVLALIGCFLHIYYGFGQQWGYETWVYLAVGVWLFDRLVRVARWLRNGVRRAFVTVIDQDYLRLDIQGVSATGHVYLFFPTLSMWRFWESHPFSVAGITRMPGPGESRAAAKQTTAVSEKNVVAETRETRGSDTIKTAAESSASVSSGNSAPGATIPSGALATTLFVRRHDGFTSKLWAALASTTGLPVFVESSYGSHGATFLQSDNPAVPTSALPNVLFVAGGVGITAVLPHLEEASGLGRPVGKRKLLWGVRTVPLVRAVRGMLGVESVGSGDREDGEGRWGDVDVSVAVGERFDLRKELEREVRAVQGGTTVVVCGPPGMADEVRSIVSGLGRNGAVVRLAVESYSW